MTKKARDAPRSGSENIEDGMPGFSPQHAVYDSQISLQLPFLPITHANHLQDNATLFLDMYLLNSAWTQLPTTT
jgi:hypothetical protein